MTDRELPAIVGVDRLPETSLRTGREELEALRTELCSFLERELTSADADGVVIRMSGGVDSALAATLCVDALGADRVTALVLPCHLTDGIDAQDARSVADALGVETTVVQLRPLLGAFEDDIAPTLGEDDDRAVVGNVVSRLRAVIAYYTANRERRLVCGTTNRTELLLGYFTKYGDGAADLRLFADLYTTEVRALAGHLDVPSEILEKPSTAGFWTGRTGEDDMSVPYGLSDVLLSLLVDEDLGIEGTADALGIDPSIVGQYADSLLQTSHKREPVPTPGIRIDPKRLFVELESRF